MIRRQVAGKISLMSSTDSWQERFQKEIEAAERARQRGNEGQARVCARRAAGVVIQHYFEKVGLPFRSPSAYDLLQVLAELPQTPPEVRAAALRLTLRVTPEFNLPIQADLIADARWLAKQLLDLEG